MNPSNKEIENILNLINKQKFDNAKNLAIAIVNKYPNYQFGWKILGVIYNQLGLSSKALEAQKVSIKLLPNDFEAHYNLAITYTNLGKLFDASESFKKAIQFKSDYFEALNNLGIILFKLKEFIEAKEVLKKAILIKKNSLSFINLGNVYKELNNFSKAINNYNEALFLEPNNFECFYNLGLIYSSLGDKIKSISNFEKAINIRYFHSDTHRQLSLLKKYTVSDEHFKKLRRIYKNNDITDFQRCDIAFALAKANEDLGNFEKSFHLYIEGNKIRKRLINYDIKNDITFFNNIKTSYLNYKNLSFTTNSFEVCPIFIVGMPRSGTTLIEQILSSHSSIYGAGELSYIGDYGYGLSLPNTNIDKNILRDFRDKYLNKINLLSKNHKYVTDKMPTNFQYLGLIKLALPESKIIHVKRDPVATCWSNFKRYFTSTKLGYCYDLDDIIAYYKLYTDLIEFWKSEIKNFDIYELDYDELTYNQETEIKKLIEYLKLNWEDNCLKPHLNDRAIETASKIQVREKIYTKSSLDWLNFKEYLGDKFKNL